MSDKDVIRVRQVMKTRFDVVDGLDTVEEALTTMRHKETKCLIVKKRHEDDEYGIVMISDIAHQVLARDRAPERVNIYEVMSKPVITINPEMDIRYASRLFTRFGLSRAPVIDSSRTVIGVVSLTDMVFKGMFPDEDAG
jgi:predicted transcriptional regulator